jgi:hypothetical protein
LPVTVISGTWVSRPFVLGVRFIGVDHVAPWSVERVK